MTFAIPNVTLIWSAQIDLTAEGAVRVREVMDGADHVREVRKGPDALGEVLTADVSPRWSQRRM